MKRATDNRRGRILRLLPSRSSPAPQHAPHGSTFSPQNDAYELPFATGTISHLVLFDVFHHVRFPTALLKEARRALAPHGRLILFEPFVSWCSRPVYALFHHEPLAMGTAIESG